MKTVDRISFLDQKYKPYQVYWKKQLEQVNDVFRCSQTYIHTLADEAAADTWSFELRDELYRRMSNKVGNNDTGIFVYLLAAFGILLKKYSGNKTVIINTPLYAPGFNEDVHAGVTPVILDVDGKYLLKNYLEDVKTTVKESYCYQNYPLQLLTGVDGQTYSNVAIAFENIHLPVNQPQHFDLSVTISGRESLLITLQYNPLAFEASFVRNISSHLELVLYSFDTRDLLIEGIDILPAAEKDQLLYHFNQAVAANTTVQTFQALFEKQVEKTPYAAAVAFEDTLLTYHELNERGNALAEYLRTVHAVKPNDSIGLMADRSDRMIIGLLGILKAGAAFLPIDTSMPAARIIHILQDAGTGVLLTDRVQTEKAVVFQGATILLDELLPVLPRSTGNLPAVNTPADAAYIIYTSGSTGRPKGVIVGLDNLTHYVQWANRYYFNNVLGKTFALFTSISFDLTITSIFTTLLRGDLLYVCGNKDISDILLELFNGDAGVNTVKLTPSHISMLSYLPLRKTPVQHIIIGGETLTTFQVNILRQLNPDMNIYNEYGPTEITVGCTIKKVTPDITELSSIGIPIADTTVYILDDALQLLPAGITGEICIGGKGVARGYLNREDLTAEKFVQLSFDEKPVYRTGDLGRWNDAGEIIFLGRRDNQVKIRGYRIELGEVETALLQQNNVKDAVVMVREEQGVACLVAWYTEKEAIAVAQLKASLAESLPAYMIPAHFIRMDKFPLNANGKIDRAALPAPGSKGTSSMEAPANAMEATLLDIFRQVLGREEIGVLDHFFEVGGDSIKAMQIASYVYETGHKLEVRTILKYPTIRELAPAIRELHTLASQETVTGSVPLTPIQWQHFAFPRLAYHHFNFGLLFFSEEPLDEAMIQAVFGKLQEHHDALRITFTTAADRIIQYNQDLSYPLSLEVFDYVAMKNGVAMMEHRIGRMQGEIDLQNGPLMKLGLFHLPDGDRLALIIHHLIIDVVSLRIIFEDLGTLARQYKQGKALALPRKTDAFKVWAEGLQEYANSELFLRELPYWENALAGKATAIHPDFPEGRNLVKDSTRLDISLDEEETALLLTAVNSRFNTTINDILLTALALSLEQSFGMETCMVLMEGHGREAILDGVNINRTVGYFTTVYPVVLTAVGSDLSAVIKHNKRGIHEVPNKGIGYGILKYLTSSAYKKAIDLSWQPQIVFNYFGQLDEDFARMPFGFSKEKTGSIQDLDEQREYELYITAATESKQFSLIVEYSRERFSSDTIKILLENYRLALCAIIEHCCAAIEA